MLLAIDVGNTEISFGLFDDDRLETNWRIVSVGPRTPDEWCLTVLDHVRHAGFGRETVTGVIFGSVAPTVTAPLRAGVTRAFDVATVEVSSNSPLPVKLDVDEPRTVGADRVINTLAAVHLYQADTIVVDFGTATTFDCITAAGSFIGGVIAPGLQTAAEDLALRAAKIPVTSLFAPERVIGRTTEECVRAGVLLGAADAADGLVRRIKAEWPTPHTPRVVSTGGLATIIQPLTTEIETVEPHLTLVGLRIAASYLMTA